MERTLPAAVLMHVALAEAGALRHDKVGISHLVIASCSLSKLYESRRRSGHLGKNDLVLLRNEAEIIETVFEKNGLSSDRLRRRIRQYLKPGAISPLLPTIEYTYGARQAMARAEKMASPDSCSALHMLAACLARPSRAVRRVFKDNDASRRKVFRNLQHALSTMRMQDALPATSDANPLKPPMPTQGPVDERQAAPPKHPVEPEQRLRDGTVSTRTFLDRYAIDLVGAAEDGTLNGITGRRDILLQIIQTLARSTKSNPILVGPPGTGKTALVEALAIRIAEKKDAVLRGCRIFQIDSGALLGGTGHRGDLEERITGLIKEVQDQDDVILFVDEIHVLLQDRTVADLLKPALSRGSIRCIGATTTEEFRTYIEKDAALERRFYKVDVPEPSRDESISILGRVARQLSGYHRVSIPDESIEAAVDLSIKFDRDHFLPDKAIDLLDKAAARVSVPELSIVTTGEMPSSMEASALSRLTPLSIASVLSEKLGVPVAVLASHLGDQVSHRLAGLGDYLANRIRGQDDALQRVTRRLNLAEVNLQDRNGPVAVFLFLGPSGVGKTETAKALASFLFGDESSMIRIDLSEFKEEHSVSKLIGSPPGYVGHDREGQLTKHLRTTPYSVVLLDEVEKGHPQVMDLFLQLFDEGRITDSRGRTVDARHATFIMTSNLAVESNGNPFATLKTWFRPELLNRIDDIIRFEPLSRSTARIILTDLLEEIQQNLRRRYSVEASIDDACVEFLLDVGISDEYGARALRRAVEEYVGVPLAAALIDNSLPSSARLRIRVEQDKLLLLADAEAGPPEIEAMTSPQWKTLAT